METTPARPVAASPKPAPAQATNASDPSSKDTGFAAELKRIASHATSVETLKNGAKLYHLAGGREVEAAPGKSPYVVKKGNWPTASASTTPPATTPATGTATTTTTTTTTPPSTSGSTTAGSSTSGSTTSGSTTSGSTASGSNTTGSKTATTGSTSSTDQNPPTSQP